MVASLQSRFDAIAAAKGTSKRCTWRFQPHFANLVTVVATKWLDSLLALFLAACDF